MNAMMEERSAPSADRPEAPRADRPQPPPPPADPTGGGWYSRPGIDPRRKSPLLACILSVVPGLGQIYVGYYQIGFVHATVWGGALAMAIATAERLPGLLPFLVLFTIFFYLYNVIDAGRRAALYNQALAGIDGIELPDMTLRAPGGSVGGGVLLIAFGGILLSNTLFGLSLEWVEQWWPLAPLLLGVWLLVRGIQDRAKSGG